MSLTNKQILKLGPRAFKMIATGYPVMRFTSEQKARKSFENFKGPGSAILVLDSARIYKIVSYKSKL